GPTPVVIVRALSGAIGLAVDELLGRQEIVIKSLGSLKPFQKSFFAGATIDPEGRVVLVIDVGRLLAGRVGQEALAMERRPLLTRNLMLQRTKAGPRSRTKSLA